MTFYTVAQRTILVAAYLEEGSVRTFPEEGISIIILPSQPIYGYPPLWSTPFSKPLRITRLEYLVSFLISYRNLARDTDTGIETVLQPLLMTGFSDEVSSRLNTCGLLVFEPRRFFDSFRCGL